MPQDKTPSTEVDIRTLPMRKMFPETLDKLTEAMKEDGYLRYGDHFTVSLDAYLIHLLEIRVEAKEKSW